MVRFLLAADDLDACAALRVMPHPPFGIAVLNDAITQVTASKPPGP